MSKTNKKGSVFQVKMEMLIVLVFMASFIIWAVSRCNATRLAYEEEATPPPPDTVVIEKVQVPVADTTTVTIALQTPNVQTVTRTFTPLYICIDSLNMRRGPSLDSSIVAKLSLFEEVDYLNEITEYTESINMGKVIANEPWVKVRTKKGREGWVFGAGVEYYKIDRTDMTR